MQFPNLEREKFESTFRKPKFLRIYPGQHIVRVLGPNIHEEYSHYVKRMTIQCIGEECPVCDNNRKLRAEHSGVDTGDIPGYSPRRRIFYTNVLDRTSVKRCTQCGASVNAINGTYPPACPSCQILITAIEPAPANEVKILSRGVEFFEQLQLVQKTTLGQDGEPLGLENYDVQLLVGSNKQPIPSALTNNTDKVDYDEEDLFDLPEVIVQLTANEVNLFLRDVPLRDIFLARNSESDTEEDSKVQENAETESNEVAESVKADIQESISKAGNLFG